MLPRLAILVSHPIQYYAPLFKTLAATGEVHVKVFYSWGEQSMGDKFDHGFGKKFNWDIPLLDGYEYEFLKNDSADPGVHHFRGIKNPDLISRVESFKPDAILVFGWSFVSHLKALRYFKNRIPVYFRGDSTFLDATGGWKELIRTVFLRWVYSHVDLAFVVGKDNEEYYRRVGMKKSQLVYAPHAIDNDRFSEPDELYTRQALELRQSLAISETDFVFLFCGKLEEKKNPLLLLRAFKNLSAGENFHLVFTGEGPLKASLIDEAKGLEAVHFLPLQNQQLMPAVYRMGDVFVLPSQGPGETWGLAVNEAMASSRAVVVSNKCGCAADLLEEESNGFVFQSGNQDDLLSKLKRFAEDRTLAKKMGKAGRKKIAAFSYERICETILSTIKMTSAQARSGRPVKSL